MSEIYIVAKVDKDDDFSIEKPFINYNLNDNKRFTYTFWKQKFNNLPKFFSHAGLDTFYISLVVLGIDRIISRDSGIDCWTRTFKVYIPVLELEKWEENKVILEEMLNFLSGDIWEFEFRKRNLTDYEQRVKDSIDKANTQKVDINKICMFSGGLDSFIGVIDLMEQQKKSDVLYVSHYGGGKGVIEYQKVLTNNLLSKYPFGVNNFYSFFASAKNGIEDTTRTRSFMFFAHAIILATAMDKKIKLIIPENGLISLNIPLTNSRLGTSSTRTTHPYYMTLLQQLITNLNIEVSLENPYQFKTKGEMIQECLNTDFLKDNIVHTMSCSHPDQGRMSGNTVTSHCGNCLPCVIRRASILKADIADTSTYRDLDFTSGPTARVNLMSYKMGLEKYSEKYSFFRIQNSGPIDKNIREFTDVYNRGMRELAKFLEGFNESVLS
ncbi:Qat anti-phage system QueC-like protein QatC [Priestia megaterium]|uniref:Qat anti-phage system QueC-like protein QatC n=1 Tax=Priestia megaterium TaxID=1404 RepID=UPI002452EC32|nr:Qat anti-phage system QueC-like protein QatC [Priestia megaterium]MDH3183668.1 ATPase [Priestia megaterium]